MLQATTDAELEAFSKEYAPYLTSILVQAQGLHITTQEGIAADISVTDAGWSIDAQQVPIDAQDGQSMSQSKEKEEASMTHFPTSQALLSHLSPAFNSAWAAHLLDTLDKVAEDILARDKAEAHLETVALTRSSS